MIETIPSGTVLHGRYRIERVLGSGGFGHVYYVIDMSTSQPYAVKEYLVSGANGQEQLKHEAAMLSQLHHPNLPAFHDAFMEQGRYYIVLSYIEGHDLTDLLRKVRQRNDIIPIAQVMGWILSICDAVMFLHNQRPIVIHRDIKPDNIRIMPNRAAVLVDMGNAKAAADGARTLFFIRHQGTPGYAPPEQYPGGIGTDARSDVYALAATLYFALTGQEPPSVSTRNQAIQQHKPDFPTLQQHLATNPPEINPEEDELRQFKLGVSKPAKPAPHHSRHLAQLGILPPKLLNQLNQIIQRAMAMKPQDRYQHVAEFVSDLRRVIAALPAPLQPPTIAPQQEIVPASADKIPSPPTFSCPRCKATFPSHVSFCTQCGMPIYSDREKISHPPSAEQTPMHTPHAQAMQAPNMSTQRPNQILASPNPPNGIQGLLPPQDNTPVVNQLLAAAPSSQGQRSVADMTFQKQATEPGSQSMLPLTMNQKLFIGIVVILVILITIAIIVLLIFTNNHSGHASMQSIAQHYPLRGRGLSYQQQFSYNPTASIAGIATQLW